KGDEGEEGVTSEGKMPQIRFSPLFNLFSNYNFSLIFHPEFDKFLEERAKAAEMTPGLPSPPSSNPGAAQGTPSKKKQTQPEDTLFAM
ncbi:hypothetical protein XENOCAPTIV_022628, partial [Xenoophorus captivus]